MPPSDEEFELRLGGMGGRDRSYRAQVLNAANIGGLGRRTTRGRRQRFTGARIGRGGAVGVLLGSGARHAGARNRRAVVKARYVRLAGKGAANALAHLRYIVRDGTTREGERGQLYGPGDDNADGRAFLERGAGDRHQFRVIVAAEDGAQYDDLKPMIRRVMAAVEQDLGTALDWVAVDHFNTGHPHTHIMLRGADDRGHTLVIARSYMSHGLRARVQDAVDLDLGPRSDREIAAALTREIDEERWTGIDRRLVAALGDDRVVSSAHRDTVEQAARSGRLRTLERMGLAENLGQGRFRIAEDAEARLRELGRRGDIVATLNHALRGRSVPIADQRIYEPHIGDPQALVGRVAATGLQDEVAERRYLVIEALDGRAWHVDAGIADEVLPQPGSIVRIEARRPAERPADRVIVEVARANGGVYAIDAHLKHDPGATQHFADAHVRRLEALRRGGRWLERAQDGSWPIPDDFPVRARAHDGARIARQPVAITLLSDRALEALPAQDGPTWLDEGRADIARHAAARGFGAEARAAMDRRRQWLVEQGLLGSPDEVVETLRQRALRQMALQLSRELGLPQASATPGERIEGVLRRTVRVGLATYAVIERSRDFTLVPWRKDLDQHIGKAVSGIMRETAAISWTIGRPRGPEIGM